ncbi:hypothetical protein VNI00_006063 [Paramarasmius palmivorus]|uniref:Nephrocystin 3-like N-terminal domain-containing protein n=1 Tax=Paramarasmius palmivorus TaxID=297713 RepID=A0AAW0DAI4_9AGAR
MVAAAFFFSRNDVSRDKLDPLVASIVYQFSKSPSLWRVLGPRILDTIRSDPRIFETAFENQFQKLIVEPCSEVESALWEELPNVIIIDGLDECVDHLSQERLVSTVRKVITSHRTLIPWIFLICSRPEPQIRDAFTNFNDCLESLDVNSSEKANKDVEKFILDRFANLRKRHPALRHESELWPSKATVDQLVARAQGQFIFAVTVTKYIDTRDERPQDRLDDVLRIYVKAGSTSPYSDLDLLYLHILSQCQKWDQVQPILRLIRTPHRRPSMEQTYGHMNWRSCTRIEDLLGRKRGEVAVLLSRLHAVLHIPDDDSDIEIAHASFTEFLSDTNRCAHYHTQEIPDSEYDDCVATLLLRTLSLLTPFYPHSQMRSALTTSFSSWINTLRDHWSKLTRDSFQYWHDYCVKVNAPSMALLTALNGVDPYCLLAASLYYNFVPCRSHIWQRVVNWAENFGSCTNEFIAKVNIYMQGYRVAFPPEIPRQEAVWQTFEIQASFDDDPSASHDIAAFCREVYGIDKKYIPRRSPILIIFPVDNGILGDWAEVTCTKDDQNTMRDILQVLRWMDLHQRKLLLDDIRKDTCGSVIPGQFETQSLVRMKQLVKKIWEALLLGHDGYVLPHYSFMNPSYNTYSSGPRTNTVMSPILLPPANLGRAMDLPEVEASSPNSDAKSFYTASDLSDTEHDAFIPETPMLVPDDGNSPLTTSCEITPPVIVPANGQKPQGSDSGKRKVSPNDGSPATRTFKRLKWFTVSDES